MRTTDAEHNDDREAPSEEQKVTFWTIVKSTLAAAIGVQSKANRERDFKHGTPVAFITAGLIFTAGLVAVLVLAVRLVLGQAG